jgi:uncharacterized protein involved in exopolysaccharide biosynthesis
MKEPLSATEFLRLLARRWRILLSAAVSAAVLSFLGAHLLPKKYTSEALLLIETPGISDSRASLIVSSVYLDSLRTYAMLASSDELFEKAANSLGLRETGDGRSLSELKESAIKVEIPRNSRILAIRATLRQPEKEQALAKFLAEATVERNLAIQQKGDELRTSLADSARQAAEKRMDEIEEEFQDLAAKSPAAGLEAEVEALVWNREMAREELKFLQRRDSAPLPSGSDPTVGGSPLRTHVDALRERVERLDAEIRGKQILLARAEAKQDALESRRKSARKVLQQADSRFLQEQALEAARSERLQIIQPGVLPDKPSHPRIALYVLAATALALLFAVFAVTLQIHFSRDSAKSSE